MASLFTHYQPQHKSRSESLKTAPAGDRIATVVTAQKDGEKRNSELELLRQFDLNADFGPCVGISRMERWERANKFGLDPPQHIKILLQDNDKDSSFTQCLWDGQL